MGSQFPVALVNKHIKILNDFSEDEKQVLKLYINKCYYMNNLLRQGLNTGNKCQRKEYPDICHRVNLMDGVFKKKELETANKVAFNENKRSPFIVYRGVNSTTVRTNFESALYLHHLQYVSTSTYRKPAEGFAGSGAMFKILLDPKKVNFMHIHQKKETQESEILLERGVTLVYKSTDSNGDFTVDAVRTSDHVLQLEEQKLKNTTGGPHSPTSVIPDKIAVSKEDIMEELSELSFLDNDLLDSDIEEIKKALEQSFKCTYTSQYDLNLDDVRSVVVELKAQIKKGGKVKVKGRSYKVRVGPRGGRYIIRGGKKVYL
jgi:hypothetical protein